MTVEDAVAWCAARDVSVIFRSNATLPKSVIVLIHGSPIKAEKATLAEAVEEVSRRFAQFKEISDRAEEVRRHKPAPVKKTPGATR